MALFSLLGFTWLTLTAPSPEAPASTDALAQDIRVVLFINSPKSLHKSIVERIAVPLGQDVEVLQTEAFNAAAKRAHVKRTNPLKAAVALAHPLRLSHAVTISVLQPRHGRSGKVFLEVFVGRLRPVREIVGVHRYYLPDRQLTPSMARAIVQRLKGQIQAPPRPIAPRVSEPHDDHSHPPPAAVAAPQGGRKPSEEDDVSPLTQDFVGGDAGGGRYRARCYRP